MTWLTRTTNTIVSELEQDNLISARKPLMGNASETDITEKSRIIIKPWMMKNKDSTYLEKVNFNIAFLELGQA